MTKIGGRNTINVTYQISDDLQNVISGGKGDTRLSAERISTKKISDQVADYLEEWIETGKVRPGDKLPSVRELCELFQVGRSAVRDAITTLKGKGMVHVKQGEGTFISEFNSSDLFHGLLLADEKDIRELFSVRKLLEVGIVEMAATHHEEHHLVSMKEAIEELETCDTIDGWQADYHFHLSIAKATKNDILVQLMQTISQTTQKAMIDFHNIILTDTKWTEQVNKQHMDIFHAIKNRDEEAARLSVVSHLSFVEKLLSEHLKLTNT